MSGKKMKNSMKIFRVFADFLFPNAYFCTIVRCKHQIIPLSLQRQNGSTQAVRKLALRPRPYETLPR